MFLAIFYNKKSSYDCSYRVLAYSSFIGPDSVGEDLIKDFESRAECSLDIINGGSSSELEAKVFMQPNRYDAVLGLQYDSELTSKIKWFGDKKLFAFSPMIILKKGNGGKELIVPDSRKSEVGKNYRNEGIQTDLRLIRVSSWTKGLSLFNQTSNISFYTFAGSYFYFLNSNKNKNGLYSFNYKIRGKYLEYFRLLNNRPEAALFIKSLFSKSVQNSIWNKNFMYPVVENYRPKNLVQFAKDFDLN